MLRFFLLISAVTLSVFVSPQCVFTSGKAKNVMMGIDLSATVALDTLLVQPHLYALGPVDDLQGEITVFDGKVYAAQVTNKRKQRVKFREAEGLKAPFLVYSYVPEWKSYSVEVDLQNLKDIESIVDSIGRAHGFREKDAFPFRMEAIFHEVSYHIIQRKKWEKQHSHEAHNAAKIHYSNFLLSADLVGFYSRNHEGVFTHKGQYVHIHILPKDRETTGHLDGLRHTGKLTVWLPSSRFDN